MKSALIAAILVFGSFPATHVHAQGSDYVRNAESCVSVRRAGNGGAQFYNTCSTRIYVSAYTNDGLIFDGYYNGGHIDDIPPTAGSRYRWFACPASATPVDNDDGGVEFTTTSYRCKVSGT